eukprot:Nk52_evm50s1444 gene=Nk52_evmTU50s1444
MDFAREGIHRVHEEAYLAELQTLKKEQHQLQVLRGELGSLRGANKRVYERQRNSDVFFLSSQDRCKEKTDKEMKAVKKKMHKLMSSGMDEEDLD